MPSKKNLQLDYLITLFNLEDTTALRDKLNVLIKYRGDRPKRDALVSNIENSNPDVWTGLDLLSADLQALEDLVRLVLEPNSPNPIVNTLVSQHVSHDPLYLVDEEDEFLGNSIESGEIGSMGWNVSNGTVVAAGGTAFHSGQIRITTSGALNDIARIHLGNIGSTVIVVKSDVKRAITLLYLNIITDIKARFGFQTDFAIAGAVIVNGFYFEFNSAASVNWACVTRNGGFETRTTTTKVVNANDWYKLEIVRLDDGNIDFYINDILVASHTATVPTEATAFNIGHAIEALDAAVKRLNVDYFRFVSRNFPYASRWT